MELVRVPQTSLVRTRTSPSSLPRASASPPAPPTWMELVSAWPMCSAPVTLGGGMTMTKGGLVLWGSALKKPHSSHLQPAGEQGLSHVQVQRYRMLRYSRAHRRATRGGLLLGINRSGGDVDID